ncbi:glycosyltransferase family 2 protein [Paenibacillus rhizovicinus]|uniref:Glycosyltransferase family 2 protein n=1 Tax=Paenibacillus rhizovicinus TaxID=2704463 RepID=A0A6C0P556_9BACL|nr:glycosyltransferase family 2 protein [Paenibacillus rhizovicinus]QHW33406.1 glycosyltransferase family 2 protein [Paenibacillus rhizovicinus]
MHSSRRSGNIRSRSTRSGGGSGTRASKGASAGSGSRNGGKGSPMPKKAAVPDQTGGGGLAGALKTAYMAGFAEGAALLRSGAALDGRQAKLRMNEHWTQRSLRGGRESRAGNPLKRGQAYADGFAAGLRQPGGMWVPVALTRTAAAVVLAGPGTGTEAVRQLLRLPFEDIIVVLEGAGEESFARFRAMPEISVYHTPARLGTDVGRSVGARMTTAELVLFADGNIPVAAEQLAAMLAEAHAGHDLVLADVSGQLGAFRRWDEAARIRAFMNWSLGRPELSANSAAVLPHVWTRSAMERVGLPALAVPPMAHRAALEQKLRICCSPVSSLKSVVWGAGGGAFSEAGLKLSAGDHIEALRAAMREKGARLSLPDGVRRRLEAGGGVR